MRMIGLVVLFCVALVGSAHASFINYSTREINVKIVYFGSPGATAALDNLTYVYNKTNPAAKGKLIQLSTDRGASVWFFDFLPLHLGEIRGFKTRLHLYTVVGGAKPSAETRELILKGADGVVFIADAAPASAERNVANLAELKKQLTGLGYDFDKMPIVFQLVGTSRKGAVSVDDLKKSLAIGDRPVHEADVTTGVGVFDTLKAMAKLVLMELKKGADDADKAPAEPRKISPKAAPAKAAPAKAAR